jgi:hypothetical protein
MALQKVHAISISRRVVTVGEGSSRLGVLLSLPPLSYMLQATDGGLGT